MEETEEEVAARLAHCTACLKNYREIRAEEKQPLKSSLKATSIGDSPQHTNGSREPESTEKSSTRVSNGSREPESTEKSSTRVSFGNVELHEHEYMLGCHPDVKYGVRSTLIVASLILSCMHAHSRIYVLLARSHYGQI